MCVCVYVGVRVYVCVYVYVRENEPILPEQYIIETEKNPTRLTIQKYFEEPKNTWVMHTKS